jgi:RND family efflux transporter MFP subunit
MAIPGTVVAYFQATLLAQVAGYVKAVNFDKGDLVREGDIIARIDVPEVEADRAMHRARLAEALSVVKRTQALLLDARATARQAQADVAHATALADLEVKLHERAKTLHAGNDISDQDLEIAQGKRDAAVAELALTEAKRDAALADVLRWEAEVEVAETKIAAEAAALRQVEALLDYATVRAPFDGVVTARFLDPGALVQRATRSEAAQPVVTVATRGRVRVDFEVPETEVAYVRAGTPVTLTTAAYPGRRFTPHVTRVASALWPDTRTMLSEAEDANEDNALLPGLYVTVTVLLEERDGALVLPPEAIIQRSGGEARVLVLENDRVRERPVEKGWEFGTYVEVGKGLDGKEAVILDPGGLREGDHVSAELETWSPGKKTGADEGGEKLNWNGAKKSAGARVRPS